MAIPGQPVDAVYFDGETAVRHKVEVALSYDGGSALRISGPTLDAPLVWPLDRLRALADQSERHRLTVTLHAETTDESPRDPARLTLSDEAMLDWLAEKCPELHRRDLRRGTWRRITTKAGLAVAAVAIMLFVILPRMADTLAEIIPIEREIAFGKSVTAQMERFLGGTDLGDLHCTNADGTAALAKMTARLTSGRPIAYDINVTVFDHDMVNAFAAPGGQVVLMRGLIEKADSADTVAAVLAHEIGHVESRDATRHSLRAAGSAGLFSMVLGDFAGGTAMVIMAEHIFQAAYTREAEVAADEFALAMLNGADVSSVGMADFFKLLGTMEGALADLPEYLSTHPASAARADRAMANAERGRETSPVITAAEWQDLRKICE